MLHCLVREPYVLKEAVTMLCHTERKGALNSYGRVRQNRPHLMEPFYKDISSVPMIDYPPEDTPSSLPSLKLWVWIKLFNSLSYLSFLLSHSVIHFISFITFILCVCVWHVSCNIYMQKSEESLWELIFFFHHLCPKYQLQVTGVGSSLLH